MDFQRILYSTLQRTARITLNRPDKRNAIDDLMVHELTAAFSMAGKDPGVKVVVLSAKGPSFCAGMDLEYLRRISAMDLEANRLDSRGLANLFRSVYELRKPVIAAVDGPALGGGCGLASVCDFVVATKENARFAYPEVRIGFVPAVVAVFLVKRVGESAARELTLRGNVFDAERGLHLGLVNSVVSARNLETEVQSLVDELLAKNSSMAMGLTKETLSKLHGLNFVDALDFAANINASARMTSDCKQGVNAFLNKHKIDW